MSSMLPSVKTFARLPWRDRFLLVETTLWLALSALIVAVVPFRRIGRLAARPVTAPLLPPHLHKTEIRRIRWAVEACARRVPWRAVCFEQGLAAQIMLRRRGVAAVLYFGAAPGQQQNLAAHVWVKAGDLGVVGHRSAHQFAVLAKYPESA